MTDTQDHHYVPKFFLESWCGTDGKVTAYSRRNGHIVTSVRAPKGTGFEPNLYSLRQAAPEQKHAIEEKFMAPYIDTPAASIVRKIFCGEFTKLTTDERSDFTRFILSLRARHPDAIALAKATGRGALTDALARDPGEYLAVRGQSSASTLLEWTQLNVPHLFENFGVSGLPGLIANEKAGERIFAMPWGVHDVSHANLDLLLSDRPCLLQGSAISGDCLVVLPLSPTLLFFACNQPETIQKLRATDETKLVKAGTEFRSHLLWIAFMARAGSISRSSKSTSGFPQSHRDASAAIWPGSAARPPWGSCTRMAKAWRRTMPQP
jgi:hypothetical protein